MIRTRQAGGPIDITRKMIEVGLEEFGAHYPDTSTGDFLDERMVCDLFLAMAIVGGFAVGSTEELGDRLSKYVLEQPRYGSEHRKVCGRSGTLVLGDDPLLVEAFSAACEDLQWGRCTRSTLALLAIVEGVPDRVRFLQQAAEFPMDLPTLRRHRCSPRGKSKAR